MKLLAMNKLNNEIMIFDEDLGMWMKYADLKMEYDPNTNTHYKGYYTPESRWVSMAVYDKEIDHWHDCWMNRIKSYSVLGVEI